MKPIQKLVAEASELEQRLTSDIALLAAELRPLPKDRDVATLDTAWGRAKSSQLELASFLKAGLLRVDACDDSGVVQRRLSREARKHLQTASASLRLWGRIEPIVLSQLRPRRRKLVETDSTAAREPGVIDEVFSLFLESVHTIANPLANDQGAAAREHGCHRDIPYPMPWFSRMIGAAHRVCLALRRQRPLRFLDVGSGGGTKVLAATTCFDICDGLEYDKATLLMGRRFLELLEPERCRLIHGDALRFAGYGDYDVIYFYRPLIPTGQMAELEERIVSQARPGTVLLIAGSPCLDDLPGKGVHRLAYQVYITGMSSDEAREVLRTAERMGSLVPGFGRKKRSGYGYWKPLLEVSARNGYYLPKGD